MLWLEILKMDGESSAFFATTQDADDAYTCRSIRIVRLVSKFDEKHHHRVSNFTFLKENPPFQTQ